MEITTVLKINNKFKKGFTLIELLVVIAIIGILIAVGSISYTRAVQLSRDSRRKTDLEQIRQALETYRSELAAYPESGSLAALEPDYISALPTDPKQGTDGYTYTYTRTSTTTYSLCAELENFTTDPTYCVSNP
jgi:general secretion pathway protein G